MLELEKLLRWCQDAFSLPGKQTEVQGSELNCPRSETGSEPEPVLSRPDPGSFILLLITTSRLSWTLKAPILIYEHPKGFLLTITSTQWASLSSAFWVLDAEASCMLIVHITRWKDVWVPCRDPRKIPRPPLHLKNGSNMPLTTRKPRGLNCFKFWQCLTIF